MPRVYNTVHDIKDIDILDRIIIGLYKTLKEGSKAGITHHPSVHKLRDLLVDEKSLTVEEKRTIVQSLFTFLDAHAPIVAELPKIRQMKGMIHTMDWQTFLAPMNSTNKINIVKYLLQIEKFREDPHAPKTNEKKSVVDIFKAHGADDNMISVLSELTEDTTKLVDANNTTTSVLHTLMNSRKQNEYKNKLLPKNMSKAELKKMGKVILNASMEVVNGVTDERSAPYKSMIDAHTSQLSKLLE